MVEIISVYWVKIFATLLIFSDLITLLLKNNGLRLNISAVELMKQELDRLDESYIVFDNVSIRSDRGMLYISYVVVSLYGVFVVTRCDLRGKVSGHKDDREWILKGRGVNDTILNPIWENRKQINALEKKIGPQPFIPVIVFTNAQLIDDFGPMIVHLDHLQKFFKGYARTLINPKDLDLIVNTLNEFES